MNHKKTLIRLKHSVGFCWKYAKFNLGLHKNYKIANKLYKENADIVKDCKKAFFQFAFTRCDLNAYVDSYKNKALKTVNLRNIALNENEPIAICIVKDDLIKVKAQVEHHRKIGVRHFAYVDNMSTDGTFEWLEKQDDVSLFTAKEAFHANRQHAWLKLVTDVFGYDKWYLKLDSDEFFVYPGIESRPITQYVDFLKKNNIGNAMVLMLDMYSKGAMFDSSLPPEDFRQEYCYFDTKYKMRSGLTRMGISGGPRKRVFRRGTCQIKYPLIKITKSMIIDTHSNYPLELNFETLAPIAFLLHYKFLPAYISKAENRIKTEVHSGGKEEYKQYTDVYSKNPNTSFFYEGSAKYNDSMDLLKINVGDKKFFEKFLKEKLNDLC